MIGLQRQRAADLGERLVPPRHRIAAVPRLVAATVHVGASERVPGVGVVRIDLGRACGHLSELVE
jgi:hypothetical protein